VLPSQKKKKLTRWTPHGSVQWINQGAKLSFMNKNERAFCSFIYLGV